MLLPLPSGGLSWVTVLYSPLSAPCPRFLCVDVSGDCALRLFDNRGNTLFPLGYLPTLLAFSAPS